MPLDVLIEGVLFYKAGPVKKTELASLFAVDDTVLASELATLANRLLSGATRLLQTDSDVQLVTAPELSETITALRKEELKRDIGKAGAETLAVILYRGPVSRGELDRIRGVNSSYILRSLATRGLIERSSNARRVEYVVTGTLLQHLGLTDKRNLPGYETVLKELERYESESTNEATL